MIRMTKEKDDKVRIITEVDINRQDDYRKDNDRITTGKHREDHMTAREAMDKMVG